MRGTELLSTPFSTSRMLRLHNWKLQVVYALERHAHAYFQITPGDPGPKRREQNKMILRVTYLAGCRSPDAPPGAGVFAKS